jgi:hypothetical protein
MAIVFGSPEARAVVEADRAKFGDSRYPGEDGQPKPLHEWKITASGEATVTRVYHVEAPSEAEAREMVLDGDEDCDEEDIDEVWSVSIEKVEDMGEVETNGEGVKPLRS